MYMVEKHHFFNFMNYLLYTFSSVSYVISEYQGLTMVHTQPHNPHYSKQTPLTCMRINP
jgi:hypothetical protein